MVKFVTTVRTMCSVEYDPEKLWQLLTQKHFKHGYELYHATNMVKPHIDYDGICTIDECTPAYVADLQAKLLTVSSEVFSSTNWAVSRDVRQKADGSVKVGFHLVLWSHKCTNQDLKAFVSYHLNAFHNAGLDKMDLKVYRDNWNKWRVPMTSTEKLIKDPKSHLQIVTYIGKEHFNKHLISHTEGCIIADLKVAAETTKAYPRVTTAYPRVTTKQIPCKSRLNNTKTVERHGKQFTNVKEQYCGGGHSSNHNYIVEDDDLTIIRCHSEKCKDFSLVIKIGRFDPVKLFEITGETPEDASQLLVLDSKTTKIANNKSLAPATRKYKLADIEDMRTDIKHKMREHRLKLQKKYFEKFHCKIHKPAIYVIQSDNEIYLCTLTKLRETYTALGDFLKRWIVDIYARSYDTMDFLPPPNKCPSHTFNTWQGFKIQRQLEHQRVNIRAIYRHVSMLVNHDKASYEYVLNYIAHMFQVPGVLPLVSMLFVSEREGVGKNLFWEWFVGRKIIGAQYTLQSADLNNIIGRFNSNNNKVLVVIDETSGKDTFTQNDAIKNLITGETFQWERKGIDAINIRNFGRYLWFSNNQTPIPIPAWGRRFVAFKCSNETTNDVNYFKQLEHVMNNGAWTFYNDMIHRDISKFNITRDRPITELYEELQRVTIPRLAHFCESIINLELHAVEDKYPIQASRLFQIYKKWVEVNGFTINYMTSTKFGSQIKKYEGVTNNRNHQCREYVFDFQVIRKYLTDQKWLTY